MHSRARDPGNLFDRFSTPGRIAQVEGKLAV